MTAKQVENEAKVEGNGKGQNGRLRLKQVRVGWKSLVDKMKQMGLVRRTLKAGRLVSLDGLMKVDGYSIKFGIEEGHAVVNEGNEMCRKDGTQSSSKHTADVKECFFNLKAKMFTVLASLAIVWHACGKNGYLTHTKRSKRHCVERSAKVLAYWKIPFRLIFLICVLATVSSGENSDPPVPPDDGYWVAAKSFLRPWLAWTVTEDSPLISTESFLRAAKASPRRLGECELDEYFDRTDKKCSKMKEFGSKCDKSESCFSENCIQNKCKCPNARDCWGCHSSIAPCFRIEQTKIQPLQVCGLGATVRGKARKNVKLFSGGGKYIDPERYGDLPEMTILHSRRSEVQCSEFSPYADPPANIMPPAFAQANIFADSGNDVYELEVVGQFKGLLDAIISLDGNWISTINENHQSLLDKNEAIVPVWPRKHDGGVELGKTLVIEVSGEATFDFDVGEGIGVEFFGTTENASVMVLGSIQMEGRLSFKNVAVLFQYGSINAIGPMIFQSSTIFDISRCPPLFEEHGGLCLYATAMVDQADDAIKTCGDYDRGFLPTYADILNVSDVTRKLLRRKEYLWISPSDGSPCASLNREGTLRPSPNCEDYTRVLCASSIKDAITGRQYTSYFSNHAISDYPELFSRLVDQSRLPIQVGGTLTVFQVDGVLAEGSNGETVANYTVTDGLPSTVSVVVNLAFGNPNNIHVALDTFNEPSPHPHEWDFDSDSFLPSKIQVHSSGSESVCIRSVDLLLRNETGTDHLAIRIQAKLFEVCLGLNVCDEYDTRLCGRSLLYFDHDNDCAVLRTDDAKYPRDLSLNIFDSACNRLTSWSHPSLGESFMIQLARDFEATTAIELSELGSDINKYTFEPSSTKSHLVLDESNKLPTIFSLNGGDGGLIKSVHVTRYGKSIAGVDFSSLWDCINVCPGIATRRGLLFGQNLTDEAMLDLINSIECRKLSSISTSIPTEDRFKDGREACTRPTLQNISTIHQLNDEIMSSLHCPDEPYRTLSAEIMEDMKDIGNVVIPANRGLHLIVSSDAVEGTSISAAKFVVSWMAELFLEDFTLNGTTSVHVGEEGLVEVSGCIISRDLETPFIVNEGEAIFTSVDIMKRSKLQNIGNGRLDLTYVEFLDKSLLQNSEEGTMELSRLTLYEEFTEPSQKTIGGALILLEEATRRYDALDDEDNPLCFGNDVPDLTLQLSSTECKEKCENEFICSGVLEYFDEDNEAQCDLCLRDTDCAFNCSAVNSVYYKPKSNFYYTMVSACPALSRTFEPLEGANLEECKLYCSWFKTCEGFQLDGKECNLYADLDFNNTCLASDSEVIYIPYLFKQPEDFLSVKGGVLVEDMNPLAIYEGKNISECSALCEKTLFCSSFYADESGDDCTLHASNEFQRKEGATGLHISVDHIFPKKSYMEFLACPVEDVYAEYNTKTHQRCEIQCNADQSCSAFTFLKFQDHNLMNCKLYDRTSIIDEIFEEKGGCEEIGVSVAYATESFVVNSLQQFQFVEVDFIENLLEDECKSLCLFDADCVALQYFPFGTRSTGLLTTESPQPSLQPSMQPSGTSILADSITSLCSVGYLSYDTDVVDVFNENETLVLEARSSDLGSLYISTPACYSGEALAAPEPTSVNRGYGYVRWAKTCTSAPAILVIEDILSPADCGLYCNQETDCDGFIYYVNYTGTVNNEKIGRCGLIGGHINIGDCDAIEQNTDVYLRADLGSVCEAACNVHLLCSSFVPRILDGGIECELYSDIALLDICPANNSKASVHIGLSYRERDALVEVYGQCFIEFEDIAEIGCYGPSFPTESFQVQDIDSVTPHHCQQHCRGLSASYYAVSGGGMCYCSSSGAFYSELSLSDSNCTATCDGDSFQSCGGSQGYALIGSTDLPIPGLTISQCKRKCFEDTKCEAIVYYENNNACELRSSSLFKTCDDSPTYRAFIESLEHYYEEPRYSYIGDEIIHTMSIDLKPDCQKFCDAFSRCEAIHYDETTKINNCVLKAGNLVHLKTNEIAEGILVARDVTLFTEGFMPDPEISALTNFAGVFDVDECKALCEAHIECGAIIFESKSCTLYPRTGFADVEGEQNEAAPHYIDFRAFVDIDREFSVAQELCIDDPGGTLPTSLSSRVTTQSSHDCAARCNENLSCRLFTYNEASSSDCILYGEGVNLKDSCSVVPTTFVMYTRGRFTEREDACLKDEDKEEEEIILLTHKTIVECAALCDAWFNCRSLRIDQDKGECRLYTQEQYSTDSCTESVPPGYLFTYFSEFAFVRMSENFCVPSNKIIGETLNFVPLEACKALCEKHVLCVALEHNQNGDCALYSSSDFSIPCAEDNGRVLYISYKDVIELKSNGLKYEYKSMQGCFDLSPSEDWVDIESEEACQLSCGEQCLGYQYFPTQCNVVSVTLPGAADADNCREGESFSFRVERYPYQKMENTCLQNPIYNYTTSEGKYRIYDTDEYECLALCDAHPSCRYYLYGTDTSTNVPEVRECILFQAQAQQLDDCASCDSNAGMISCDYNGHIAFVNGRTFIDQVTWFGEPEFTYAVLPGLSYQECASLCDALDNKDCSAFLHTWNYRRSSSAVQPQIFTQTRIIRADFKNGDDAPLFLQFDGDGSGQEPLIMTTAKESNDDALKPQQLANEGSDLAFNIKFWKKTGKCLTAGQFSELPLGFTRDVIYNNFTTIPTCQKLVIGPCDEEGHTITLKEVEYLVETNPGRFALSYTLPNNGANESAIGCLTVQPMPSNDFWQNEGDNFGDIYIQPEENCTQAEPEKNMCNSTTTVKTDDNNTVLETSSSWEPTDCNDRIVDSTKCMQLSSQPIAWYFDTTENVTSCQSPPIMEICNQLPSSKDPDSNITTSITTCSKLSETIITTCWYTQRNALDLLEIMHEHFESASECRPANTVTANKRSIMSRSYGPACGYDDSVATMPIQLFAYASDPVLLSNDATSLCLADDLSLVDCRDDTSTAEWVHVFGDTLTGGEIFHGGENMRCLTRNGESLQVEVCDTSETADSFNQRWDYDGNNGLLKVPGLSICIISNSNEDKILLGNCTTSTAKWSQYSECKLNTRVKTKPMLVELVENTGSPRNCIKGDVSGLGHCSSLNDDDRWEYYYESSHARLQKVGTDQCIGRYTTDTLNSEPKDLPTGLMSCGLDYLEKNSQFYLTILGGEEADVFQWTKNTPKTFVPTGPKYCIKPGQYPQDECADLDVVPHWRSYADVIDATEISVKPSLLLDKITDPGVQYQLWLFSAEGKLSRKLKALSAGLERDISRVTPVIDSAVTTGSEALALVGTIGGLVADISDGSNRIEKIFKALGTVLKIFIPFPYIGPVIKNTKLPTITKQIAKRLNDGTKVVDKVDLIFSRTIEPFEDFLTVVSKVASSLKTSVFFLTGFVEFVTRTSFCAYQKDFLDFFTRTQQMIKSLLLAVNKAVGSIADMKKHLSVLNVFKGLMNSDVFKIFKQFRSIIADISKFADTLSFITKLVEFEFCFAVPKPCWKTINFGPFGKLDIPWICWGSKTCAGLKILGDFMGKIESIIRSIPGVGYLWGVVEKALNSVLGALFKFFGNFLPKFEIKLGFVDDIKEKVTEAKDELYGIIEQFGNLIKIPDFTAWMEDAVNIMKGQFPDDLIDINCDSIDCISEKFGITVPDIDADFPSFSIRDFDAEMPDHYIDIVDKVVSEIGDFHSDYKQLLEGGVECKEYTTVRIDFAAYIRAGLGLKEGDIAGLPDCPFNVKFCTDIRFPGLDDFRDSVNKRISDLGLEALFSQRRHLSDECVECTSGGVAVPLGFVGEIGVAAMSKLVKLGEDRSSNFKSFNKDVAKTARFISDAYCKKTNTCDKSWKKEFEIPILNWKVLLFEFFDFSAKLVLGKEEGKFKAKIKIGGFLNVGFTAPRSNWLRKSKESKHAVKAYDSKIFGQHAEVAKSIGKINCLLDFIETTRNVRRKGFYYHGLNPSQEKRVDAAMETAYNIVDKRDSFRPDRYEFAEWLDDLDFDDTTRKELKNMVDMLEKKKDYDTQIRAEMVEKRVRIMRGGPDPTYEYPSNNFLDNAPEGSKSKCAEPIRNSIFQSDNSVSLLKLMKDRPKGYGAPIRKKLHDFYDSKLYEIFSEIEFHTTKYGNLFGAGMDLGIERESLLGNFETDTTEFSWTMVGPFWVSGGNWEIPFEDMFADHAPWRALEFLVKFVSQRAGKDTRHSPTKKDLLEAMIDAGKDNAGAEHLSFAERQALKVEWALMEITLDLKGEETSQGFDELPLYGTACDKVICIGIGFDPTNFDPSIKNCVNEDHTLSCDGTSINCIELTVSQCLQNNNDKPCAKKAFTDCPATCGLYSSVQRDSDWPRCKVIDACVDTQSLLYFPDEDPSTPDILFQCQDLNSGDCTLNASSGDGATNMLVWKWCPNHCGYEDKSIRERDDFKCTVRPPILPSDPPSVSATLTPSEGPTSSFPPSLSPSSKPTGSPTASPSESPSTIPSRTPSKSSSSKPKPQQTTSPTTRPTPPFDCSTLKKGKACKASPVCDFIEGNCHPKLSSLFTHE